MLGQTIDIIDYAWPNNRYNRYTKNKPILSLNHSPPIHTINDWIHLLNTLTREEFATLVDSLTDDECTPCFDVSRFALLRPSQIKRYTCGNWQCDLDIHDCMEGIFRLLNLDPSISLMQQHEVLQLLRLGETPMRWSHQRHFSDPNGDILTQIPTACGVWNNEEFHFVTVYICAEYWTILDPLLDLPTPPAGMQRNLHQALRQSFRAKNLPVPLLPPYRQAPRLAVQNDAPRPH